MSPENRSIKGTETTFQVSLNQLHQISGLGPIYKRESKFIPGMKILLPNVNQLFYFPPLHQSEQWVRSSHMMRRWFQAGFDRWPFSQISSRSYWALVGSWSGLPRASTLQLISWQTSKQQYIDHLVGQLYVKLDCEHLQTTIQRSST